MKTKLTKKNALSVFDNILKLSEEDQQAIFQMFNDVVMDMEDNKISLDLFHEQDMNHEFNRELFSRILNLPKNQCQIVIEAFNQVLDELCMDDFFGTEGQLDPRGDHRD